MLNAYLSWVEQGKKALVSWGTYIVRGDFDEIVVAGMGGSGILGDYLQVLSNMYGKLPVYVVKSHLVPSFINKRTLFIAVSYSGNTIETIHAFRKALEKRATVVAISSGGLLGDEALRRGVLHIPLPQGLLPRASLPSMLYSVLGLLDASGYTIVSREIASTSILFLEENLKSCLELSGDLSTWLYTKVVSEERIPIIATHSPLEALAVRGKNEFNENSKIVVKLDVAPEWMHNDIIGYEMPITRKFGVLEVVDPADHVGYKLVEFMEKLYREHDTVFFKLKLQGKNMLEKLMYGSLILGLTSVKLAEKRGIDPAQTKSITLYKALAHEIFSE